MQLMLSHRLNQIPLACVSSSVIFVRCLWNLSNVFYWWKSEKLLLSNKLTLIWWIAYIQAFFFSLSIPNVHSKNWMKSRFIQINCIRIKFNYFIPNISKMYKNTNLINVPVQFRWLKMVLRKMYVHSKSCSSLNNT